MSDLADQGNETPAARVVEAATHAIAEIVRERHRRPDTVAEHMAQMGFPIEVHDEDYADFGRAAIEAIGLRAETRSLDIYHHEYESQGVLYKPLHGWSCDCEEESTSARETRYVTSWERS